MPETDPAPDAAPAPSWQPSEATRRHLMARAHLDSIVLHLVREFEDPTAITDDLDLDQPWRRPEAEPLAAIRATLAIRNVAATLLHEHIGRARGAGRTWADLATVLDIEKAARRGPATGRRGRIQLGHHRPRRRPTVEMARLSDPAVDLRNLRAADHRPRPDRSAPLRHGTRPRVRLRTTPRGALRLGRRDGELVSAGVEPRPRRLRGRVRAVRLAGEPLLHLDEADQLAAVHHHLHHRGVPTAATRPLHANTNGNALP